MYTIMLQHYILEASLKMWADPIQKRSVPLSLLIPLHWVKEKFHTGYEFTCNTQLFEP